jgi:hypothetical protein
MWEPYLYDLSVASTFEARSQLPNEVVAGWKKTRGHTLKLTVRSRETIERVRSEGRASHA